MLASASANPFVKPGTGKLLFATLFTCTLSALSFGLLTTAEAAPAGAPSAADLMQASDRARGGLEKGITWNIQVESVEDGEKSVQGYKVRAKGVNAVAECTAPARCKGEIYLFNDRNLWFFKPGVKKPIAISARQKLSGQAANGDIASTNYARDYEATLVGEEKVGDEVAYKLDLKAKAKNVTYDRIRYWVSKDKKLAIKAEFLTVSGNVFKSAILSYGNEVAIGGKPIPFISKMVITDAAFANNVTTISYESPKEEDHPESIFNVNNIMR